MSDDLIKRLRHDGQSDRQYLREAKTVLRAERTEAADCIEKLVRQRDGWEETALMYAQNVDFWKSKLAKAVEALNIVDLAIMENTNETDWRLWGEGAVSDIRTVLAELEK